MKKIVKKSSIFFITLVLYLVILIPIPVMATPIINLNGQQLSFDVPPTIENGRILVPLRAIFEVMGATVEWNQDTQTVTAIKDNTTVILQIGLTTPTINNQVKQLDVSAKIINGRTLAPLRFVGEAFGGLVDWNENTQTVTISMTANSTIVTNLQEAMIVKVIDGDTLVVNIEGEEKKVRLILVDTPESVHPDKTKNTEYGKLASAFTSEQLKIGQTVYLQKDVSETDKYNRLLRYVWLAQPTNINDETEVKVKMHNAKLLLEGYAQIATFPPDVKYVDMFKGFVTEARNTNKGLWGYEEQKIESTSDSDSKTQITVTGTGTGKIKGNINSKGEKIYHIPGGVYYNQTDPEEWFETEADAQVAGYRKSKR